MQAWHLCLIELMIRLMMFCGIFCHCWTNALRNWLMLVGLRARTRLPRASHTCSMGARSGDREGHSITSMLLAVKKFRVKRAVWGLALSCCRIPFCRCCCINGITTGVRMSSQYTWAVTARSKTTIWVLLFAVIPAQTCTLPPPKRSCLITQLSIKRSPGRRHTKIRPSAMLTLNLDSSVNNTLLQRCLVQRKCWRAQINRFCLCLGVRFGPL